MNELENAVEQAIKSNGEFVAANKAYLEFIKANFIIPIEKNCQTNEPEVLFFADNHQIFLPVFTDLNYLNAWAESIEDKIDLLRLSGVDLLKGIGSDVNICLDMGAQHRKIFNPSEVARMKGIVLKFFSSN